MVYLVILCCALIHVSLVGADISLFHTLGRNGAIIVSCCKALSYLLYPLLGWMADVRFTRYKFVLLSFVVTATGSFLAIAISALIIVFPQERSLLFYFAGLMVMIGLIAIGLFESTAIQFGMDQMLEAFSDKLSSFIHWYYWSSKLGSLLIVYISFGSLIYYHQSSVEMNTSHINDTKQFFEKYQIDAVNTGVISCLVVQVVCSCAGLCLLICYKRQLNIDRTGKNPFKLICGVLRYAWNHSCPENRSAFTYWEEDIPPRIDLGKRKYGGPFTTEEVEDTKSFFRIIMLLLSLFGFHLTGHSYSQFNLLARRQCPTPSILLLTGDSSTTILITVIIGVPLYQLVFVRCCSKLKYVLNMLKLMGLGLLCCLIKEVIQIIIFVTMTGGKLCQLADVVPLMSCYIITSNIDNNHTSSSLDEYRDSCDLNNIPFLLLIIPNIFHGLAFLLVFMTTLEFICAQAPLRLKGLLIGIWYALLAFYYIPVGVLESFTANVTAWEVFQEVKIFLVFLSLMLYLCVSRRYRYRLRDEVVNEQFLVEEVYERRLALAEKHEESSMIEVKCANNSQH